MKSIYYTDDNDAGEDYQNSWWPWWIFVFNIICNQPLRTWQGASCWFFHIKVPLLFSALSSFPLSPWSSDPSQPVRLWMGEDSVDRRSPLSVPTLLTRAAEVFLLHLLLLWQIFFYIFIICFLSLIFIKSKRKQVMLFCWKWKDIEKCEWNFFLLHRMLPTTQPWWWKETVLGKLGLMKRLSLFNIAKCVFFVLYLALLDETVISKGANIASSALSLYCLFYLPIHLNICCSVSGWGAHSGQGFHSSWFTTRPWSRYHRLQLPRVVLRRWEKDRLLTISSSLNFPKAEIFRGQIQICLHFYHHIFEMISENLKFSED